MHKHPQNNGNINNVNVSVNNEIKKLCTWMNALSNKWIHLQAIIKVFIINFT